MKKNLTTAWGWVSLILNCSVIANAIIGLVLLALGFIFTSTVSLVVGTLALSFALINFIVKHVICSYLTH